MTLPFYNHKLSLSTPSISSPFSLFFFPISSTHLSEQPEFRVRPLLCNASTAAAYSQTLPESAIQRIAEKLRSLGYVEEDNGKEEDSVRVQSRNSPCHTAPGEIFIPLPERLPKYRVGHTLDPSWTTPENPVPLPGSGSTIQRFHELRREVLGRKKVEDEERRRAEKRERAPSLAELTLPEDELKRLRTTGIGVKQKLKIGKAGITEGIVNGIHERWRRSELVRIKCEDMCRLNMWRTHDLLERKTGGLVVWRSGSNIILYRGAGYKYPYFALGNNLPNNSSSDDSLGLKLDVEAHDGNNSIPSDVDGVKSSKPNSFNKGTRSTLIQGVGFSNRVRFQTNGELQLVEEADHLLDGLGPRFTDWWGYDPLPIDADLLPGVVPGYRRPFRLLPYGVKPKLTNDEMTTLKRLGRPLPCHFALGRNSKLQGLADAIVNLWEKCEIAKIAVKKGVQNTNSELMAGELKWLTGGILISRDKEFIVFYRGKDFLPASVSTALEERRKFEIHREKKGADCDSSVVNVQNHEVGNVGFVFLDETEEKNDQKQNPSEQREISNIGVAVERTNTKLSVALARKYQAEKLLAELENAEIQQEPEMDKEGITEEERFMLRKVGLKMKPFLLLGRRGVFDGTIENMHLHWKYREVVKIIVGGRNTEKVHTVAQILEAESGGILVTVERVSKGYAIIVYRGKNYKRPGCLRPRDLLTKKEALKRYVEAQRSESLKLHLLKLNKNIEELKLQMAKNKETNNRQFAKQKEHDMSVLGDVTLECMKEEKAEIGTTESKTSSASVAKETDSLVDINVENRGFAPITCSDGFMGQTNPSSISNVDTQVWDVNTTDPLGNWQNAESDLSVQKVVEKKPDEISFTVTHLSNRERLILRKQALMIKKRPVLAVGKSNIVTGVAKAIKAHFEKYPLAIVNVKGRAEGTSVKELVFELMQATGSVFVSQEPSKVILYRGWGAGEVFDKTCHRKNNGDLSTMSRNVSVVSGELLSAIRLECGLESEK